jgi:hypothetical protein
MTKRKSLTKKLRFEVFKRDSFVCQYCGKKAPDAVLVVDHIHPVAKGGSNDLMNLVTSCEECNQGKSDRSLSDSTVVSARHAQASALQARREQIEMIAEWQRGLAGIDSESSDAVSGYFQQLVPGWHLNAQVLLSIRPFIAKHGLAEVMSAIRKCAGQHLRLSDDGKATRESAEIISRVLFNCLKYKEQKESDPVGSELRYIAGIARNRYNWVPSNHRRFIEDAHVELCIPTRTLRQLVLECKNWSQLEVAIEQESSG